MSTPPVSKSISPKASLPVTPLTTPIFETTTFVFESAESVRRYNEGGDGQFLYTRYGNPTVAAVEASLAELDGAERAVLFGSGMAATATTLLALLRAGDEVICGAAIYGGTFHLLNDFLTKFGITTRFVELDDFARLGSVIGERTRLVWFESPTNPNLRCVDIAQVAAACRERGVVSAFDNTFASPINQRPLDLGIDLAMQSATKYLNGHSDVTAGVVCGAAPLLAEIEAARRRLGGILDPQAAYALGRSLKTLAIRVAHQNASALQVARALEGRPGVARVYYPGLESHPDHALAARQMRGFGGMICIDLAGGEAAACRAFDRLRLISRAVSLGGVESVCSLPILTSHWGHDDEQLTAAGVTRGMLRVSIGLEDPEELTADLVQAITP
jgi:cystathionine beta-lyase/cystathionine gamma-synthase